MTLLLLTRTAIGYSLTVKQMAVQASVAVPAECPDEFTAELNANPRIPPSAEQINDAVTGKRPTSV